MIRSRLSFARLYLKIVTLLLPACAYFIAVKVRFGFNFLFSRTPPAGPAFLLEHSPADDYRVGDRRRRIRSVECRTVVCSRRKKPATAGSPGIHVRGGDGGGFLYRQASYSRLVIGISAVALFVLATIARVAFRVFLELLRKDGRNEVKILVVGTDRFARRVGTSLLHGEVLPCRIMGFVRLPDQEIAVEGPVYELDQIPAFSNGNSINDIIIALPAARLSEVQKIAPVLEKLCVPTRVVIDLGEGIVLRDRLIDLGGIHMLDLRPTLAETGPYLFQKRIFDVGFSVLHFVAHAAYYSAHRLGHKTGKPRTRFLCSGSCGIKRASFPHVQVSYHASRQPGRGRHALDLRQRSAANRGGYLLAQDEPRRIAPVFQCSSGRHEHCGPASGAALFRGAFSAKSSIATIPATCSRQESPDGLR